MSNTNVSALYPEFWASAFDQLDVGEYNLQNFVSREHEKKIAQFGDTVNIPITPDSDTADDWVPGATITASGVTQTMAQIVLNKSKKRTFALNQKELSLSPYNQIQKYGVPQAKSILKAVNLDLYLELMKTSNWVDAISAVDEDDVVDAKKVLDTNEVSTSGRKLVLGTDDTASFLKLDAFQHFNVSGTDAAMKEGLLQRKFGFDIVQNNIISTYTPEDLSGAVDNGSNYAEGDTTMVVKDFNDDVNPIRPGDIFKIAAESGTPYHTVVSTTLTTSDTTGITFTPAIATGGVLDNAVITITPTRSALGFTESACALAARAYAPINLGGAMSTVIMVGDLPIRIVTWLDSATLNYNIQYDILYGVKMVNADRVCRILTS